MKEWWDLRKAKLNEQRMRAKANHERKIVGLKAPPAENLTDSTSYDCEEDGCESQFTTPRQLHEHKLESHPSFRTRAESLTSQKSTRRRLIPLVPIVVPDNPSNKTFFCSYCSRKFRRQEYLMRHVRSLHHPEKSFKCLHCDEKFSRLVDRQQHQRTHGASPISTILDHSAPFNQVSAFSFDTYPSASGLNALIYPFSTPSDSQISHKDSFSPLGSPVLLTGGWHVTKRFTRMALSKPLLFSRLAKTLSLQNSQ